MEASNGQGVRSSGRSPAEHPWSQGEAFQAALDVTPEAFIAIDDEGRVVDWNRAASETFGWSRDEALGRSLADLIVPERLLEAYHRALGRVLDGGGERLIGRWVEFDACRRDGDELPVEVAISRVEVAGRRGLAGFIRDISERRKAERELREERERFRRSFRAAPIGMALVAPDGSFLEVNSALCRLLGRSGEELLALGFQTVTHPDDLELDAEKVQLTLDGSIDGYALEKRYLRPDGSIVWTLLHVSLIRDGQGRPLHFISQVADISDRAQKESELSAYHQQLRELELIDPISGLASPETLELKLRAALAATETDRSAEVALAVVEVEAAGRRAMGSSEHRAAIRRVGQNIAQRTREGDLAARTEDWQLALLMPATSAEEAGRIVERLGWGLEELELELRSAIVASPADGRTSRQLLTRAAEALELPGRQRPVAEGPAEGASLPAAVSARIQRVLGLVLAHLRMDVAFVAELCERSEILHAVAGDGESFGIAAGDALELEASYCRRMDDGQIDNAVRDVAADPELRGLSWPPRARFGSYIGVPLRIPSHGFHGSLCVADREARPDLGERELELMRFLAELVAEAFAQHELESAGRRGELIDGGIAALLSALAARDHYTGEHSDAVVDLAGRLAGRLGMPPELIAEVEQVALLHDIGKVGIPDSILQKQGSLSELEWELMRQHPAIGERIVASVEPLAPLAPTVRAEHERFDGTGYPDGLAGEDIPAASRVVFACDAYHAMVSDRPYRLGMDHSRAVEELRRGVGTQFDPEIIGALLELLGEDSPQPRPATINGA